MKKNINDEEIKKRLLNILKSGVKIVDKKGDEDGIALSPKACLAISLMETAISDSDLFYSDFENKTFSEAYKLLEKRFMDNGYIDNDEDKKLKPLYEPKEIFLQVINAYYPEAGSEKLNQAWIVFVFNMSIQGNAK